MKKSPEISVLICTWNREHDLARTLESLKNQTISPDRFEVVVVDNNSSDNTAEVVENAKKTAEHEVVYIMEKKQGKSNALNTGISSSRAPIIACTDDDCKPEPNWLEEILKAFEDPNVGVLGGHGISVYPDVVLQDPYRTFLAHRFLGDHAPFNKFAEIFADDPPLGLNLSFRKEVPETAGGFDTNLGPTGKRHLCREETAFVRNAQAHGYRVFYCPTAVVNHHIQEERICWKAIKKQAYDSGIGTYRERYAPKAQNSIIRKLGLTLYFGIELLYSGIRTIIYSPNVKRRTIARFRAVAAMGKMAGIWG